MNTKTFVRMIVPLLIYALCICVLAVLASKRAHGQGRDRSNPAATRPRRVTPPRPVHDERPRKASGTLCLAGERLAFFFPKKTLPGDQLCAPAWMYFRFWIKRQKEEAERARHRSLAQGTKRKAMPQGIAFFQLPSPAPVPSGPAIRLSAPAMRTTSLSIFWNSAAAPSYALMAFFTPTPTFRRYSS